MGENILINLAVSFMLQMVQDKADRKKWARTLAKVFVAIQNAANSDEVIREAIAAKLAEQK